MNIITFIRGQKQIVIYVNESDWNSVPNLDWIADVEVYNIPYNESCIDMSQPG